MRVKNPVSASFCLVGTFRKRYERNHYLKRQRVLVYYQTKVWLLSLIFSVIVNENYEQLVVICCQGAFTRSNFVESDRLDRMNTPKMTLVATDREFKESDSNRTCSIASNSLVPRRFGLLRRCVGASGWRAWEKYGKHARHATATQRHCGNPKRHCGNPKRLGTRLCIQHNHAVPTKLGRVNSPLHLWLILSRIRKYLCMFIWSCYE